MKKVTVGKGRHHDDEAPPPRDDEATPSFDSPRGVGGRAMEGIGRKLQPLGKLGKSLVHPKPAPDESGANRAGPIAREIATLGSTTKYGEGYNTAAIRIQKAFIWKTKRSYPLKRSTLVQRYVHTHPVRRDEPPQCCHARPASPHPAAATAAALPSWTTPGNDNMHVDD